MVAKLGFGFREVERGLGFRGGLVGFWYRGLCIYKRGFGSRCFLGFCEVGKGNYFWFGSWVF